MVQSLTPGIFRLDRIDEFYSGDETTLQYKVKDAGGADVDITNATETWRLVRRAYQDRVDAELTDADTDVTLTETSPAAGEFEVTIGASATTDLWGSFTQVVQVEDSGGDTDIWAGEVILTA
jgi:hypothetical protein